MERIGTAFRRAVSRFAQSEHIPLVKFSKKDRKIEVMRRHLAAQEATGRSGVAAVGVAQEFQNVFAATVRERPGAAPWFSFYKADRRVTCFYFYLWDEDFGPAFVKVCAYFLHYQGVGQRPRVAKRQCVKAGIGFTALSNGFASDDRAALQAPMTGSGPVRSTYSSNAG